MSWFAWTLVFCDDRRRQRRQPIELVVQAHAGDMVHRARIELDRGSGYRIEHHMAGIDEIVQIFNLHREVLSDGIFGADADGPNIGKYTRARRGTR
jgi:hypothetical protein